MKKLVSVLLAMVLALTMMVGAIAEQVDVIGTWSTTLLGMDTQMTINEDGTYTLEIVGLSSEDGVWEYQEDGNLLLDKGTDGEVVATVGADTLNVSMGGMALQFTRGEASGVDALAIRTDATMEELQGEWTMTEIGVMGMVLSAEMAETTASVGVTENVVIIHDLMGDTSLDSIPLELEFSEGALRIDLSDDTSSQTWIVGIMEDGRLNFTINVDGVEMAMLMEKVVGTAE